MIRRRRRFAGWSIDEPRPLGFTVGAWLIAIASAGFLLGIGWAFLTWLFTVAAS